MIEETLKKIEGRLGRVAPEQRAALVSLFGELKTEIDDLAQTEEERARSVAGFADISAHEATRTDPNPGLADLSLKGLASSVQDLETSHPRLVQLVNSVCDALSNIGV
jgi:hypothetical protein